MKIALLKEFIVLAEELNFSRASKRLNMTQPGLSRHIQCLEYYFGAKLLCRSTHKVELTPAGTFLVESARDIVSECERTRAQIKALSETGRRHLSIVFINDITRLFLSSFLRAFGKKHPDISMECWESEQDASPSAVESGICDLAFIVRPRGMKFGRCSTMEIFTDPLCAVVNKSHPFAERDSISFLEVSNWPVLTVSRKSFPFIGEFIDCFCERYNVRINAARELPNPQTCCFSVDMDDQAMTLLPRNLSRLVGENSVIVDIEEEDCKFSINLVWDPQRRNAATKLFIEEFSCFLTMAEFRKQDPAQSVHAEMLRS